MSTYQVVEKFVSINGEGRRAGELAAFIRFKGCNLQCSYCDTSWANEPGCESERLTKEEILSWIRETGVKNVTLTGGEPLLRKGMEELIEAILEDPFRRVEIETNGSVDLKPYHILKKRPSFTMDYKAPDSGMEKEMLLSNLELLGSEDTLKFVVSSRRDMEKALEILEKYRLVGKTAVYFSPVFGRIQPLEIVDFLMEKKLNDVKLQIQLHKVENDMKALVLASGGVDSTTCLGLAVNKYGKENVIALTVAYGQKHTKEIKAARKTAEYYGVEHLYLDLEPIFRYSDCSLLKHSDREIPHESYAEQLKETDGSPVSTYVPFRNGLFLSSAASIALSKNCSVIYYGAHADDAAGNAYPDCSSAFHNAINEAIYQGSGGQLKVEAPFVSCTKAEVVKTGLELNVPYELTWSCYEGGEKPCGVCGTCIDRAEAFRLNGVKDPALDR